MNKKSGVLFVFLFVALLSVSMVSAVWWNPFSWFSKSPDVRFSPQTPATVIVNVTNSSSFPISGLSVFISAGGGVVASGGTNALGIATFPQIVTEGPHLVSVVGANNYLGNSSSFTIDTNISTYYYVPIFVPLNASSAVATCYDSDGGINFSATGYISIGGVLREWDSCISDVAYDSYCLPSSSDVGIAGRIGYNVSTTICPNGCADGVCVAPPSFPCYDSDGGLNYAVKGTASQRGYSETDRCQDFSYLSEADCGYDNGVTGSSHNALGYVRYLCPNGCSDGACLPAPVSGCAELSAPLKANISRLFSNASGTWVDRDGDRLHLLQTNWMNRSQYVILGNATSPPRLLEVTRITNSTSGYDDDQVELRDVLDSTLTYATITAEGRGNITIGGLSYQLEYRGASTISEQARQVRLLPPYTPRTYEGCSFPPSAPSATCTDSDATPQYPDGKNYNVMGTTRGPDGNVANAVYTDTCTSSVLREFFCQNGAVSSAAGTFTSYIGSSDYTCPYGCSSGACLPAPPATGSGVYVDSTSDKAGSWGVFSANNKLDHHFRISLSTSLPHTKTLRYATLVHTVYGEAWSTLNTAPNPYTPNMYPLVLTNGTTQLITANGQQIPLAIGSTSAPLVLELYAEKAAAFAGGTLTLNFTDGTQTSLTIAKPTQSTTSSPGSRFQVTCQGPPQRRCRWFSCRNVYPSPFQTACGTATCPAGFTTLVAPQPC